MIPLIIYPVSREPQYTLRHNPSLYLRMPRIYNHPKTRTKSLGVLQGNCIIIRDILCLNLNRCILIPVDIRLTFNLLMTVCGALLLGSDMQNGLSSWTVRDLIFRRPIGICRARSTGPLFFFLAVLVLLLLSNFTRYIIYFLVALSYLHCFFFESMY